MVSRASLVPQNGHSRGGRSTSRGATRISHAKTSSASRSVSSASTRLERASAKFSAGVSGLSNNRSRPTLETHPRLVTDEMKAEAFASCYANVIRSFKPSDRLAASAALVSCAAGHDALTACSENGNEPPRSLSSVWAMRVLGITRKSVNEEGFSCDPPNDTCPQAYIYPATMPRYTGSRSRPSMTSLYVSSTWTVGASQTTPRDSRKS